MVRTINEKWILLEERKPELRYRCVYTNAEDGDLAEEEESDRVFLLSYDGEIGIGSYNEYKMKGETETEAVFSGCWLRTKKTEFGVCNDELEEAYLENVCAWRPLPEILE